MPYDGRNLKTHGIQLRVAADFSAAARTKAEVVADILVSIKDAEGVISPSLPV